jgi:hypothetical protein
MCAPGQTCKCPKHQLPDRFLTTLVKLSCGACGFTATARSGNAAVEALRDHQATVGCAQ